MASGHPGALRVVSFEWEVQEWEAAGEREVRAAVSNDPGILRAPSFEHQAPGDREDQAVAFSDSGPRSAPQSERRV